MKNYFLLFVISITTQFAQAQNSFTNTTSSIDKVTVYTSCAQVFRKATTTLVKGKNEIEFKNLSPYIDKQSIVVGCKSASVLSVTNQLNVMEAANKQSDIKKLEADKIVWLDKMKLNQNMMKVYQTEENILLKNQVMNNEHVLIKAIDLKDMADFQRGRLTEIYLKQLEIGKVIDQIDSTLQKIDKQLFVLNNKTEQSTGSIKVILNAQENGNAEIDFSYIVPNAGWFVNYDLRVKDVSNPISLKFKANVFQQTGEEWKDVKLTLVNSNPSENTIAPYLPTWFVNQTGAYTVSKPINNYVLNNNINEVKGKVTDVRNGQPVPFANVLIDGSTMGTIADENGNFSIKVNPLAEKLIIKSIGYNEFVWVINSNNTTFPMQPTDNKTEQITVSYKKPLVDENYAQQAIAISNEEIKSLPSVGGEVGVMQYSIQASAARSLSDKEYVDGVAIRSSKALKSIRIKKNKALVQNGVTITPEQQQLVYNEIELDVAYAIALPYSIPNDGRSYQVDIKTIDMPAFYEYYAVPKLDKNAFLTAHVPNWQELKLLDGEINLFLEGKFIGKSVIQTQFAEDTLNISLGKDNGIFIERKKIKDYSKNQLLGDNRNEYRNFEIAIKNNKSYPVHLKIEDQFPLSTDKNITVEEIELSNGKLDKDSKKIIWDLDLTSKEEKKLELKYAVKHPKSIVLQLE